MKEWLYKWLPIIFGCHCREDRSFYYKGKKFPICARCTGELVGMIFAMFSCLFFRLSILVSVLLLIPMIIDGVIQAISSYESNNTKRFITGLLFGYGILMLFIITSIMAFQLGVNLTK